MYYFAEHTNCICRLYSTTRDIQRQTPINNEGPVSINTLFLIYKVIEWTNVKPNSSCVATAYLVPRSVPASYY